MNLDKSNFRITIEFRGPNGWEQVKKLTNDDAACVLNLKGLCRVFEMDYGTIRYRLKHMGMTLWQALTTPPTDPQFHS